MKSLVTIAIVAVAAIIVARSHAYERCKGFQPAELKAMKTEQLEREYCHNEDRLIEILEVAKTSSDSEVLRDRDGCWETLVKLSSQANFDRDERCSSFSQAASASGSGEDTKEKKRELLRNLGVTDKKTKPAK